jgi:hypothetical protein
MVELKPKPRPSEYCGKCRTPGYQYGGRKCWRLIGNERTCSGTYQSANEGDWELCDECNGEGCNACDHAGWYPTRPF